MIYSLNASISHTCGCHSFAFFWKTTKTAATLAPSIESDRINCQDSHEVPLLSMCPPPCSSTTSGALKRKGIFMKMRATADIKRKSSHASQDEIKEDSSPPLALCKRSGIWWSFGDVTVTSSNLATAESLRRFWISLIRRFHFWEPWKI